MSIEHKSLSFAEEQLLPISALQHLLFCKRQCALIHLERAWEENRFTAEGRLLHERVHEQGHEARGDRRLYRGLRIRSTALGLVGVTDMVEMRRAEKGIELPGVAGRWVPYPVEYKRGKPKRNSCDEVQLCAQVLCLEEMLQVVVPEGALYYGKRKRRSVVVIDADLRVKTKRAAHTLHALIAAGVTPPPMCDHRCRSCSLQEQCMPEPVAERRSAGSYLKRELDRIAAEDLSGAEK